MATLDQAIIRVIHKYEGKGDMKQARDDVQAIENRAEQLNAALVAAGAAFATFAKTAVSSFGEIETAMAKFASRAGWTLDRFTRETEASTHAIARATGVRHGLIIQATQEGISQGMLGGMSTKDVLRLGKQAAKLHAAGQTDILQAMRAGIVARQYRAPSADQGLAWIYAASQVGAGNPSDYANAFMDVAPGGSLLNINQTETLGALALMATGAPSLEEGATWLAALYKTMAMPMKDAQGMLKERLGLDWKKDIPEMVKEQGGLNKFAHMVRSSFSGPEIFEMFGRQEAVKGLEVLTLRPGQLVSLQNAIRDRGEGDPIEGAWQDNVNTWGISVERLGRSIDTFMRSWGEPLAEVAKQFMNILRWVLDALTTLNDALGGLPAILVGLTGALITAAAAMNGISAALSLARNLGARAGLIGGAAEFDKYDRGNRRNRNWNTVGEVLGTGAVAGGAAMWSSRRAVKDTITGMSGVIPDWLRADLSSRMAEKAKNEAREAAARMPKDGLSRWARMKDWLFGDGLPHTNQTYGIFGQPRQGYAPRMTPWFTDGYRQTSNPVSGTSGNALFHRMAAKSASTAGLTASLGVLGGATYGAMKKHWLVLLTSAVIGGFTWWYRKTAGMEANQIIYRRAGLRPGVQGFLADGSPLSDAPELTRTDEMQMQIDRIGMLRKQYEEQTRNRIQELQDAIAVEGNAFHRFIATILQSGREAEYEEERQLEIARANRRRLINLILGKEDERLNAQLDRINEQNNWWRSLLHHITFGLFGKPDATGVEMRSIGLSQEWLKANAGALGSGVSESMAWSILQQMGKHQLPQYDPRNNPHYDARIDLQQALRARPNANFTININVENMNDATPQEVADTLRGTLEDYTWDNIGDHFDARTY